MQTACNITPTMLEVLITNHSKMAITSTPTTLEMGVGYSAVSAK